MIEHPEDYSDSGPSLPCGDLTGAPVGAGELHCATVCAGAGLDVARGSEMATAGMGYYDPEWQRKSIPVPCVPCGCRCRKDPRPPGGWSDCGPVA